jgi:hypothetical protein
MTLMRRDVVVRLCEVAGCMLVPLLAACSAQPLPVQPSLAVMPLTAMSLEAEAGGGDGQVVQRSRASGGQTVHLGPGERRLWTFDVRAAQAKYVLSVTYSNGKEGPNEILSVTVDGTALRSFEDRDSGDSIEGWNLFVTDPAGTSTLGPGRHTVTLEVEGGDGCVEVDLMTLSPDGAGTSNAFSAR